MSSSSSIQQASVEPIAGHKETLSYIDGGSQWEVSIPSRRDATHQVTPVGDVALENFFSRPILLPVQTWTPGTPGFSYQFNPWTSFFGNKRVINRLNNYYLLSCDLVVKFMINGNGFYYGRLMADYRFATGYDYCSQDNGTVAGEAVLASQRMHIFLDPTTSEGGCVHIPFLSLRNAFSLTSGDWSTIGGLVTLRELAALKHANAATTPVDITISIWAENVQLGVPTATSAHGLTSQAGDEPGVVERIASATENAAMLMSTAPIIGPYATAASMFSRGIGAMAKQFGFSRPAILEAATPMRPSFIGNLSNGDQEENVARLTLDSKQGLTIDPGVIGMKLPDEMVISEIVSKESYLTTFSWTVAGTTDALLWNARINPCMYTTGGSTLYYFPACAFAAMPFRYWRGCMKFRFQVVASQFHKGRLRICWDPHIIPTTLEANVEYTRIIDISTERDVEVIVKWGQPYTWLSCDGLNSTNHSTSRFTGFSDSFYNGVLGVYVLNSLTTPNSVANNDISVNVFVSMVDGEFSVPTSSVFKSIGQSYQLTVQAGEEDVEDNNDPVSGSTQIEDISACATLPRQNLVFFGEVFSSFRTLLKRYTFYRTDLCPTSTAYGIWNLRCPNVPAARAYGLVSMDLTSTGKKYNYVTASLYNYLSTAYVVGRGSFRWKAILYTSAPSEILSPLTVERGDFSTTVPYLSSATDLSTSDTQAAVANSNIYYRSTMLGGGAATPHAKQPCLEFETPFYSQERGYFTRNVTGLPGPYSSANQQHNYQVTTTGSTPKYLDRYFATGEDFQLMLFQGPPVFASFGTTPTPA